MTKIPRKRKTRPSKPSGTKKSSAASKKSKLTRKAKTPVRAGLRDDSSLQENVRDGLAAVQKAHRTYIDVEIRALFADSLDADESLRVGNEQANRWDYLLGHSSSKKIIGVEPHSASNGEISVVIKKLLAAKVQLRSHLKDGVHVARWLWVASGEVQFLPIEAATKTLAQHGIEFVGRKVTRKHLPD